MTTENTQEGDSTAAQPSSPPPTPRKESIPTVEEVMRFDPFADKDDAEGDSNANTEADWQTDLPQSKSKADASSQAGDGSGAAAPSAQPPVQPPTTPATTHTPDPLAELKAKLAAQDAMIAELRRTSQTPQPSPSQAPQPTVDEGLARMYAFSMPPQLSAALRSEDDATFNQGMSALLSAHAMAIHRNVVTQLQREIQQVVPTLIHRYSTDAEARSTVEKDFYGKYPQFNKSELRPIVRDTAITVAKELGATQWSETLRDAVALRVTNFLASLTGTVPPSSPAPTAPSPPQKRFSVNGAPPRPPATSTDPNSPLDIGKALFG